MTNQIFVTGTQHIPQQLKNEKSFNCHLIDNPYQLREALHKTSGEKIIVVFLPFLEVRHFDIYSFLQKNNPNVKTFFVVNELSGPMKIKLKTYRDFIVLWKTEEAHLTRDILAYLEGKNLELRQDKREHHERRAMISPSTLPLGMENKSFQPIIGGDFGNISLNGSCIKIKAPFYNKKDFVSLTYQTKEGEYISVEGQVRWTQWNEREQTQELGVQFLTQG